MSEEQDHEDTPTLDFIAPDPLSPEILMRTAQGFAETGEFQEAEKVLRGLLEANPQNLPALLMMGEVLLRLERTDDAIEINEQAARLNPDIPLPFINMGYAAIVQGDYDRAVSDSEEAIYIDPQDPQAYGNLSLAYLLKEEWEMCLKVNEKLLELEPSSGLAHNNSAVAWFRKGDLGQAVHHVREAVERGYPVPEAFVEELKDAIRAAEGRTAPGGDA